MQVKILYFATFRSITGLREEILTLPDRATLQDLKDCLSGIHPPIEGSLPSAIFAINREFAFPEDELHDGDEVAIFPPVSGGRSGKG
jgi:molybdopterin converting factor subunit 1